MRNTLDETTPKGEQEKRDGKTTSRFQSHLGPKTRETELRLGFSSSGTEEMGSVEKEGQVFWFSETKDGFGSPWRQDRVAFDRRQPQWLDPSPALQRTPPVVGWPPVCVFRKNLAPHLKPEMESKAMKAEETMFVKVNMEGYAIGRKINLKAHDGYESLSRAVKKMFHNFYSVNYLEDEEQNGEDEAETSDHLLVYEDHEGDRMLAGDVPWELFISTVKRLYIINGCSAPTIASESAAKHKD